MNEVYLKYADAARLCQNFSRLIGSTFTHPLSGASYQIFSINPVPAKEIAEFRELLTTFIESRGKNKHQFEEFESRFREDNFSIVLSSSRLLDTGINLLTIALRQMVRPDGSLFHGFFLPPDLVIE